MVEDRLTWVGPLASGSMSSPIGGDGSDELQNSARREVLLEDPGAHGGEGILNGVAKGGRGDDHSSFAHPPEVDVGVERDGFEMFDLDAGDLARRGQEVIRSEERR